jgi:hypothetical protein
VFRNGPQLKAAIEHGKTLPSSYAHDKTFRLDLQVTSAYSHLHREATTLTKTEAWDRILIVIRREIPTYFRTRLETAMPVVGVLERKRVKSHGEGEGVYCND